MKYLKTIYLLLCCTLALAACSDDDENPHQEPLSITTPAYTNVGYNKATLSANISGTEGVNIVKRGFCYATASHPDIYDTTSEVRGSEISTTPDRPDSTDDVLRKSLCHPLQRRAQILGGNFFHDSRRDTER